MRTLSHKGPLLLIDGVPDENDLQLAAQLAARFSQGKAEQQVSVQIEPLSGESYVLQVSPMGTQEIPEGWYI